MKISDFLLILYQLLRRHYNVPAMFYYVRAKPVFSVLPNTCGSHTRQRVVHAQDSVWLMRKTACGWCARQRVVHARLTYFKNQEIKCTVLNEKCTYPLNIKENSASRPPFTILSLFLLLLLGYC